MAKDAALTSSLSSEGISYNSSYTERLKQTDQKTTAEERQRPVACPYAHHEKKRESEGKYGVSWFTASTEMASPLSSLWK